MRRRNPIGGQNPSAHARITPDRLCAASKSAAGTRDAGPLESGHTTASVALKRLAGGAAKNRFYRANRDLGRVFKTEFFLSYLSEPQLRSRMEYPFRA